MTFRVGQKVVCVDTSWPWALGGIVCTISALDVAPSGKPTIWASELGARPEDGGWYASRFRPIVERKTSIEVFTKMLAGKRVDA